jgi:hypothetical protein
VRVDELLRQHGAAVWTANLARGQLPHITCTNAEEVILVCCIDRIIRTTDQLVCVFHMPQIWLRARPLDHIRDARSDFAESRLTVEDSRGGSCWAGLRDGLWRLESILKSGSSASSFRSSDCRVLLLLLSVSSSSSSSPSCTDDPPWSWGALEGLPQWRFTASIAATGFCSLRRFACSRVSGRLDDRVCLMLYALKCRIRVADGSPPPPASLSLLRTIPSQAPLVGMNVFGR